MIVAVVPGMIGRFVGLLAAGTLAVLAAILRAVLAALGHRRGMVLVVGAMLMPCWCLGGSGRLNVLVVLRLLSLERGGSWCLLSNGRGGEKKCYHGLGS